MSQYIISTRVWQDDPAMKDCLPGTFSSAQKLFQEKPSRGKINPAQHKNKGFLRKHPMPAGIHAKASTRKKEERKKEERKNGRN